ncbi:RING-like zinc finger [Fragilaria crotonensis]|nr:RING-like zinc finger [Fragilaria crotonensis]
MRSMLVPGLCVLVHLVFYSTPAAGDPPPTVLITAVDWNPITFRSQVVAFDDQFQYDMTSQPLLMLPPNDLNLCVFPASLENMTMSDAEYLTMDRPVALLVAGDDCPLELKALVFAEIQERLTPSLMYLIVYNTTNSSQPNELVSMSSNSTFQVESLFLSWDSSGDILAMISNYSHETGLSSTFLNETSRAWDLRVNLEVFHRQQDPGHDSMEPDDHFASTAFLFLKVVLFTFLGVSPFIRAGYLWYAAGGRILVRRDENHRIIGLQYIHPPPISVATNSNTHHADHVVTLLTMEQLQALPTLVYKRKSMEGGDALSEDDDSVRADVGVPIINTKSKPANVNKPDDEKKMENVEQAPSSYSETADESSASVLFTTCTMCSVCIEEFKDGETIRILPKCNHGFHLECIKPWLTERQSCCPLCKTNVLANDSLNLASDDECQDSPV